VVARHCREQEDVRRCRALVEGRRVEGTCQVELRWVPADSLVEEAGRRIHTPWAGTLVDGRRCLVAGGRRIREWPGAVRMFRGQKLCELTLSI
jgi:hypothetical protein